MKKILIATLVFAAGIGSAFAQKPADKACCQQQQCAKTECAKKDCKKGQAACANPFAGLDLTAEQQTKLDALKADCKARKDQAKADKKEDRAAQAAKRSASRAEMLAKVKEILTPEQYVKFLENNFVNGAGVNRPGKDLKVGRPGRDMRHERRR